ncbi:MAG: LytR C-terminal domain-containing protein [Calditrichia bacterium]
MARRVRRDLSNKKIRKHINNRHKSTQSTAGNFRRKTGFSYLKPLIYLLLLAVLIVISISLVGTIDLTALFKGSQDDRTDISEMVPEQSGITEDNNELQGADSSISERIVVNPVPSKTQIEVLNGSGAPGIAKTTMFFYRKNDVDVVSMGNYQNFDVQNSFVIDWTGNPDEARRIASTLGIPENRIETRVDNSKQLTATVVLGKDYKQLKAF